MPLAQSVAGRGRMTGPGDVKALNASSLIGREQ